MGHIGRSEIEPDEFPYGGEILGNERFVQSQLLPHLLGALHREVVTENDHRRVRRREIEYELNDQNDAQYDGDQSEEPTCNIS